MKPAASAARCPAAGSGTRPAQPVTILVLADDPITADGVTAYLRSCPSLAVVSPEDVGEARMALFLADRVTGRTVAAMAELAERSGEGELPVVLVANTISGPLLVRAVRHGLVSFLPRARTPLDRTVETLLEVYGGRCDLPPAMVGELMTQIRALHRAGAAGAESAAGELTSREADILRLVAEGLTTVEIAARLNYAERTIKSVLHGAIVRLGLRNRAHAVAHAMRIGAI
ncbi:LuxR C-terminal-related transcriptional regulator [Streptomyces sp. NPDC094448]|uniref:helix-turn-helix transcriptional regulator n=1 Tax=Streptomyces sp. NPDC094448 TaxID=3366063 RepID=UPI003821C46E